MIVISLVAEVLMHSVLRLCVDENKEFFVEVAVLASAVIVFFSVFVKLAPSRQT